MRTRDQREGELVSLPVSDIAEQHARILNGLRDHHRNGKAAVGEMIREILEREYPAENY